MTETHPEEPSVVSSSIDVGKCLREAREAKKISIPDAAAQLRMTRDVIVHLEEQNWDQLHGRTYARGYFLSYTKFLGLPQDEMLAGFNIEFSETDNRSRSIAPIQQLKPAKSTFPWLPLLLIIIVAVVTWFVYQQWQATQVDESAAPIESLEPPESDNSAAAIPIIESNVEQTTSIDQQSGTTNEIDQPVTEMESIQTEQSSADSLEALEVEEALPITEGEANQNNLRISINADCWVEVRDANQQVLISRVVRGGNTVELTGALPFQVSLGQANAASVRFDGEVVDIAEYTRGNVARFTLGADS